MTHLLTLHGDLSEPSAYMQGGIYRIPGDSGVADRVVTCLKQADDSWAWVDLALQPVDSYTRAEADLAFAEAGESYSKVEADARFAPVAHEHGV